MEIKKEMDMIPSKNMKGKNHLTSILDTYPESMISVKPIYSSNNTEIYNIKNNLEEYILKAKDFKKENDEELVKFKKEYESTKKLGNEHPHFVKALDFASVDYFYKGKKMTRVEMLIEYGGPDLTDLIEKATEKEITMWMLQSLSALLYSEKRKISHFDIKPHNMVYKNGILKIIDLGTAITFTHSSSFYKPVRNSKELIGCTPDYAPPELLIGNFDLDLIVCGKVDVYCWAMSIYQIITNTEKLEQIRIVNKGEKEYNKFLQDIRNNPELAKFDKKKIITEVIIGCLKYKPEDRLTFDKVQELLKELDDEEYENTNTANNFYYSIGCAYMNNANHKDIALRYFSKEVNNYRKALCLDFTDKLSLENIGSCYIPIAEFYRAKKEYKYALANYHKSLHVNIKMLGEEHFLSNAVYYFRGVCYAGMGEYKNALTDFEKNLNYGIKTKGENHETLEEYYAKIGSCYFCMGEYKNALTNFEKALTIKTKGEEHKLTGEKCLPTGVNYGIMGEYKIGVTYCEKLANILAKLLGEDNELAIKCKKNIEELKKKQQPL